MAQRWPPNHTYSDNTRAVLCRPRVLFSAVSLILSLNCYREKESRNFSGRLRHARIKKLQRATSYLCQMGNEPEKTVAGFCTQRDTDNIEGSALTWFE